MKLLHSKAFILIIFVFSSAYSLEAQAQNGCLIFGDNFYRGDTITFLKTGEKTSLRVHEGLSWKVFGNASLFGKTPDHIKFSSSNGPSNIYYPFIVFYSESNQPTIEGGTNQYLNKTVEFYCLEKGNVPQPDVYVPIDGCHHNADQHLPLNDSSKMIMLRRAFFYENSEDIYGAHGPTGTLSLNICDPKILSIPHEFWYSCQELENSFGCNFFKSEFKDSLLNENCGRRYFCDSLMGASTLQGCKIYGPIYYFNNTEDLGFAPDPHDEWIDGPWGTIYSNIAAFNWDDYPNLDEVAVVVTEGDKTNADDILGIQLFRRSDTLARLNFGMFGWVVLENKIHKSLPEPSVDYRPFFTVASKKDPEIKSQAVGSTVYYYHGWNGEYPEPNRYYGVLQIPGKDSKYEDRDDCIIQVVPRASYFDIYDGEGDPYVPFHVFDSITRRHKDYYLFPFFYNDTITEESDLIKMKLLNINLYNKTISGSINIAPVGREDEPNSGIVLRPTDPDYWRHKTLLGQNILMNRKYLQNILEKSTYENTRFNYDDKRLGVSASLKIFPNPTSNKLNLYIYSTGNSLSELSLYDIYGNRIKGFSTKIELLRGFQNRELNLSGLNFGIYFVVLKMDDKFICQKIILTP